MGFLRTLLRIQETWSSDTLSTRIGLMSCTVNLLRESYFRTKIRFLAQTVRCYAMQILTCHVVGPWGPGCPPEIRGSQKNWVLELFLKEITVWCHSQGINSPNPFMVDINLLIFLLRESWTVKCGLLKNPPTHPGYMVLGYPEYPNRSYEPHRQFAARELFSHQYSFSRSNHSRLCHADLEL